MTVKTQDGSRLTQWHSLRVVAAAGVTALLVAACGGDSGCPSAPPFGGEQASGCSDSGNTTPKAADLSITLSAGSLPNDGSSTITATITAVNGNRNALPNIPVTVSVNNNAVATVSGSVTDDVGVVLAQVGIGADSANRSVTVTASSGSLTRTATSRSSAPASRPRPCPR